MTTTTVHAASPGAHHLRSQLVTQVRTSLAVDIGRRAQMKGD